MPGFFALLYISAGLLFVGLGIPLALGKIGPNLYYGMRTARTLSNPVLWYAVNRVSGIGQIVAGAAIILGVLLMYLLEETLLPQLPLSIGGLVLILAATAVCLWHSYGALRRLDR